MFSLKIIKKKWILRQLSFVLLTTLIGINLTDADDSVAITKFEVPPHVELHDDVVLECDHNLPVNRLFHVEWHHNDQEFYRFSTEKGKSPKMAFNNTAGIIVDLKASSEKKVILLNVKLSATGLYECSVIRESPDFNDDQQSANMTVVVIPSTKPKIEPPPSDGLRPGSQVDLNCTAAPSIPAASLEWRVNDKPVPKSSLRKYAPELLNDGLVVSRLGLRFKLERSHYRSGELKLKCTAKIATYYTKSQEHNHSTNLKKPTTRSATAGDAMCLRIQWWVLLTTTLLLLLRR